MSNVIRFEIETDANYSAEEKVELLDAFLEFMAETDSDIIDGTEDVKIVSKASVLNGDNAKKDEIIQEFLKEASISVSVSRDGEDVFVGTIG